MSDDGEFIESAEVHGFSYGTGATSVKTQLQHGHDLLFILDIVGGMQMKKSVDAVTIFLVPPHINSLEERLIRRGTDSADIIQRRMSTARDEIRRGVASYDYIIHNNKLETALNDILAVIRTEHLKRARREDIIKSLMEHI
jgi:guanylate kinase